MSETEESENIVYLVPPGKLRCYVTGKLRKDTPEEHVRQRWARSLVEEYGYPKNALGVEVKINMGRARKSADIVIFRQGAPHVQEEVFIIIEAKRDDKKPTDEKYGEGQLMSYMSACPTTRFGLWVGEERRAFQRLPETGKIDRIGDIPRFGDDEPERPTRADLVPAHELTSVFRRCHNYIYANAGLQKAEAFHEMLKLIFCKTYDEEEGGDQLQFSVHPKERVSESGQRRLMEERLSPLFQRILERYPFIFDEGERIKLEPRVAAYVVSELQYLSFLETTTDVKGKAYEELVGENLRGDRGEFFTPRNVCDMCVQIIMALYPETQLTALKVLDCCSGTGGFLVSWLTNLHKVILRQEEARRSNVVKAREHARRRVREACNRNLFGLDINPFLVRTCQMNLVLHGDGSSNVVRADSVQSPGEWEESARRKTPYGKADIVLTNPPFGGSAKIDDGHILDQYELPRSESRERRASMPAEQLFVETALKFVKPGGHLAIVLPDGILNNPGLRFIRSWLLRRSRLIASIDLPKTTFKASGGVNNPSVLLVQKLTREEAEQADKGIVDHIYQVFMAVPKTSGINNRAKAVYLRQPDGREKTTEKGDKIIDDQIAAVPEAFREWRRLNK
ncbi:restriction endonuclease subunit M [Nitrospira sp. T9]